MKKRILFLFAGLLLFLFVGCNRGDTTTPSGAAPTVAPTQGGQTTPPTQQAEIPPVGPVSLPLAEPITLSVLALAEDAASIDYANMAFWQMVTEETNIHFDWEVVRGVDAMTQRLHLMFISGQFPDLIMAVPTATYIIETYGVNQSMLIQLDEFFNENYLPIYYGMVRDRPYIMRQHRATDGHIYSLGRAWDAGIPQYGVLIMNHQLLTDHGIPVPNPETITFAEFENTLRALRDIGDPSIIPFTTGFNDQFIGIEALSGLWGRLSVGGLHMMVDDNGIVYNSAITPEYRQFLEWISMAYNEGLIDMEMFTQDRATMAAKIQTGNVGFYLAHRITGSFHSFENILDYHVVVAPPAREGVRPVWRQTPEGGFGVGMAVIPNSNLHVRETIALLDFLYDPMIALQGRFGMLGTHTAINDDGFFHVVLGEDGHHPLDEINQTVPASHALHLLFRDTVQELFQLVPAQIETITNEALYRPFHTRYAHDLIWRGQLSAEDTEAVLALEVSIREYYVEAIAQFIMNGITDASWDTFKNTLDAIGIDRMIEIRQRQLNDFLGR